MSHLGDLGVARPEVDISFGFFGTTIRVHPDLSDLSLLEVFTALEGGGTGAVAALTGMIDVLIHPEDVVEFRRLVKEHRQSSEDVAHLAMKVIEAITDRPTQRPADSSGGPSTTATRSVDASVAEAVARYEGRPDLQLAVLRASA